MLYSGRKACTIRALMVIAAVIFTAGASAGDSTYSTDAALAGTSWMAPSYDDSAWTATSFHDLPAEERYVFVRRQIVIRNPPERPLGVYVAALASHEVYWDGVLIGRGGVVSEHPEREVPGPIQAAYLIPPDLATSGVHVIAMRASAHNRGFSPRRPWWALYAGDYETMLRSPFWRTFAAVSSFGGLLIGTIFALFLYLTNRQDRSAMLLSLLCATAAALLVAESWREVFGYTYDLHVVRLLAVTGLSWLLNVLLVWLMAVRFPFRRSSSFAIVTTVALSGVPFIFPYWDMKTLVMFMVGFGVAALWAAAALWSRRRGAAAAATGLGCALSLLAYEPIAFADGTLFVAIILLFLSLLGSHALQVRSARIERDAATLRSARLEAELLRRQIQPHFLMNTLAALTEWIEREPAVAIEMVEAFAGELRLLGEMSSRRLVPLSEELALCRLHLEVMSRRTNRNYTIHADTPRVDAMVPPAMIHTLVENALTHAGPMAQQVDIRLRQETSGERARYTVDSPLGSGAHRGTGTGLRYVTARLQESFGTDWRLTSAPSAASWCTEIDLPLQFSTAV